MNNLFGFGEAVKGIPGLARRSITGLRRKSYKLCLLWTATVRKLAFTQEQIAGRGFTNAGCVRQQGIKHRL